MVRSFVIVLDVVALSVAGGLFAYSAFRGLAATSVLGMCTALLAINLLALTQAVSSSNPTDRK